MPNVAPSMVPSSALLEGNNTAPVATNTTEQASPSTVPSSSPVSDEVEAPVPTSPSSAPSFTPSKEPIPIAPIPPVAPTAVAPTVVAPTAPVALAPTAPTVVAPTAPVAAPVFTAPTPTSGVQSDMCELNESCAALNLTGLCCPTIDDQFLLCCNGAIEPTCQRNDKCAALGLEGACCPTAGNIPSNLDGIYLDCCSIVPDVCATERQSKQVGPDVSPDDNSTSCVRMSAVEFKEALNEYSNKNSAAAAVGFLSSRSVMMTVGTVLAVVMTTLL